MSLITDTPRAIVIKIILATLMFHPLHFLAPTSPSNAECTPTSILAARSTESAMMDEMDHKVQDFYALMAPSSTSRLLSATIGSKSTAKLKPLSTNSTWILITTHSFMLRRNTGLTIIMPLLTTMPHITLLPTIPLHLTTFLMLLPIMTLITNLSLLIITLLMLTKKAVFCYTPFKYYL